MLSNGRADELQSNVNRSRIVVETTA